MLKGQLIEIINNRLNSLVRENGFKGMLVINDKESWGLSSIEGKHLLEPTEFEVIEAIDSTEDLKTLVIYY